MTSSRWIYQSASRLAEAIRAGETTSEEVVRGHLDQIQKFNSKLNAVVSLRTEVRFSCQT